jgi:hypothetical protein
VVYGLQVESNLPIPGLAVLEGPGSSPLSVRLNQRANFASTFSASLNNIFYASPSSNQSGLPHMRAGFLNGGAYYGFFYSDGPRFAVDLNGLEIWADWPDGYSLEDACTYLIGQIINFALRLRGVVSLHASSFALDDRAIAIMGAPGTGKSTTAAAFARLGYPILSDDVAVLSDQDGKFFVQPGYPRVNLWPDSVRALFGSQDELPLITPTWGKRYLSLNQNGYRFQSTPLPLCALYLLYDREDASAVPVVEELTGAEALMTLAGNTYLNFLLNAGMRKREFEVLRRMVAGVPVRRVRPAGDPSKIFELCEVIDSDARRLATRGKANVVANRNLTPL